ncbi:ATP-dependent nuclease [Bremerella sp. T1]|uniref:ATP-dependent nuclease n=1 Tax=Bremerella sp. TYQ1 TaxID=3119568 RepID=UPI001CC9AEA0|nr:ATP-dependent endonuclease [Bremerella volcania]UBM37665.1 ATP-dependent endonuclease [Bremerella volcania]
MKLLRARVNGFRRLENVLIDFDEQETVFVGPNNSGKTSAAEVFRLFLKTGEFSVHDFSVSKVPELDRFGRGEIEEKALPCITLDLWFKLDPETEFGRAGELLPDADQDYDEVGIRIRYMALDGTKLREDFLSRMTPAEGVQPRKPLSYYLSMPGTLKQHYSLTYYALDATTGVETERPLKTEDGKRILRSLIRVEFVDAQRKIDDHESPGSTRLSKVFTRFYKRNLAQVQTAEDANDLIDKHNDDLTGHYSTVFADLLGVIQGLGVPSVNDRRLRVTSALVPEKVLESNANLTYFDEHRQHELPESYNGLGIKNLIYLAVQICEFHLNWMSTEESRPLALVIFIEEPEAHLHAQAQQTFITNAWKIINEASVRVGEDGMTPQVVVTTHSSHILDTVEFGKVRYFRRCHCDGEDPATTTTLNASVAMNLQAFSPAMQPPSEEEVETEAEKETPVSMRQEEVAATLTFLKRYMKLTHCDLFFSDAVILVEGTVEKLLLPEMIERVAPGLKHRYLTVLEVGGAYAHLFASLLEFIAVPYLIITDIDSVSPEVNRSACRADTEGAVSSNAALSFFLGKSAIKDLCDLKPEDQIFSIRRCYLAYQRPSPVNGYADGSTMHGRTLEETFTYENLELFRAENLSVGVDLTGDPEHETDYQAIYEAIRASKFKKTEFALSVISSDADWVTPKYITDGLKWLEAELNATVTTDAEEEPVA